MGFQVTTTFIIIYDMLSKILNTAVSLGHLKVTRVSSFMIDTKDMNSVINYIYIILDDHVVQALFILYVMNLSRQK